MSLRKSVPAPTKVGAGAPTPKKGLLTVVYADDVLAFPQRDDGGVKMLGNIVLVAGAKMQVLYLTPSTQKFTQEIEGDEDQEGFVKKAEGQHPGDSLDVNEYIQNGIGKGFILIYGAGCGDAQGKVLGTPCNPMKLKGSFEDSKDGKKHIIMFEQSQKDGNVAGFYDGEITLASNYEAATAAVDFLIANGPAIQLPSLDTTAAVTAASIDQEHNTIVSLIGGGGSDPATVDSGVAGDVTIILKDDTQWVGLDKAVINLEVFKAGATTYLFERSRS